MLAVATCIEDQNKVSLSTLYLFSVENNGQLRLLDKREFKQNPGTSMYFYLNFEYKYRNIPMIFAFQADGTRNLDIFAVEGGKLDFVYREMDYHDKDFSAIRGINGRIVSVDYDGVMRIMGIPE